MMQPGDHVGRLEGRVIGVLPVGERLIGSVTTGFGRKMRPAGAGTVAAPTWVGTRASTAVETTTDRNARRNIDPLPRFDFEPPSLPVVPRSLYGRMANVVPTSNGGYLGRYSPNTSRNASETSPRVARARRASFIGGRRFSVLRAARATAARPARTAASSRDARSVRRRSI
jgi:hypothetical protein